MKSSKSVLCPVNVGVADQRVGRHWRPKEGLPDRIISKSDVLGASAVSLGDGGAERVSEPATDCVVEWLKFVRVNSVQFSSVHCSSRLYLRVRENLYSLSALGWKF